MRCPADRAAAAALRSLLRLRGVAVRIVTPDGALEAPIVAARGETRLDEGGDGTTNDSARSSDWITDGRDLRARLGRMPAPGDLILVDGDDPHFGEGSPGGGPAAYRVSRIGQGRCWRPAGPAGPGVRIHSFLVAS